MAVFLALCLLSRLAYSLNDVLVGRLARRFDGLEVSAWRGVSLGLTMAPLLWFVPAEAWTELARHGWEWLAMVGLTGALNVLQLRAARHLPFGLRAAFIVTGMSATSVVLGWILLHERLSATQLLLCVVLVGSAAGAAFGSHARHEIEPDIRRGAALAGAAAVLMGVVALLVARLARETDPFLTAWAWEFGSGLVLLFPLAWRLRRGAPPGYLSQVGRIALASSPTVVGSGASALALTLGAVGIWAAAAGSQVLFTALLGAWWHRETMGTARWVCFTLNAAAFSVLALIGR